MNTVESFSIKTLVTLPMLALALLFFQSAAASSDKEDILLTKQKKIEVQCERNFAPKGRSGKALDRAKIAKICNCVSENFVSLSKKEKLPANSLRLLHYVEKYYAKELSKEQIDRDPFYLDEFFIDIGSNCIKDPSYRHSYKQ